MHVCKSAALISGAQNSDTPLQNSGKYDEIYIEIADTQAITDNFFFNLTLPFIKRYFQNGASLNKTQQPDSSFSCLFFYTKGSPHLR